ncbi:MAG: MFS transporter [Pontiella sp.]
MKPISLAFLIAFFNQLSGINAVLYFAPRILKVTGLEGSAAHAIGQGAVIWVFISEIFPNRDRAAGPSFGCFTHWIFAALITLFFPRLVESFSPEAVLDFSVS